MKRIFFTLISGLAIVALMGSCTKFNDQFTGLDDMAKPTNIVKYNYTLVDGDYTTISKAALAAAGNATDSTNAKSIGTNKFFTQSVPASTNVPYLLKTKYPYGDIGSSALITYSFNEGVPAYLNDYASAATYTLVTADYAASGSTILGFYPDKNPATYLPAILAANVTAPAEGKIEVAKYVQYSVVPTITITPNYLLEENFDYGATAGNLTSLTTNWVTHSGTTQVGYATTNLSMTGYPSSGVGGSATINAANSEDINRSFTPQTAGKVYASALVNFSAVGTGTYFLHFMEQDGSFNYACRVSAKDNGSGKILFGIGASSTITYGTTAFDLNTTYLIVTSYDISTATANLYVLSSVAATEPATPEATSTNTAPFTIQRIAIRQGGGGLTLALDGLRVTKTWADLFVNNFVTTAVGANNVREVYYKYSGGTWAPATGIYAVTTEDYQSMGTATGQPGKNNNFSSSILPENYLPTLLTKLFSYAQNGTTQMVSYKYYSGGVQTRVDEYIFNNGVWTKHSTIVSKTDQFLFTIDGWVFDPTVTLDMVTADYKIMVDWVLGQDSIKVFSNPQYFNEEFYFGFGSRYGNVSFRLSYRDPYIFAGYSYQIPFSTDTYLSSLTTDADKAKLLWNRLKIGMKIFLEQRYPNAIPQVSGVDVFYNVRVKVYYPDGVTNVTNTYNYLYKCTAAGTPPSFEFVSVTQI